MTTRFEESVLFEESFVYDQRGWITDLTRTQGGNVVLETFGYGSRGRLETVHEDGQLRSSYTYDASSNRTSYTGPFPDVTTTVYDARDRLLQSGDVTYTYSEAGELISKSANDQTISYDYDVLGNLRQVVLDTGITIDYVIDAGQRRIGKKVDGVLVNAWLYQDGLKPIAELDGSDSVVSRFVYGARSNLPSYMIKAGRKYRMVADHLGSPRLVVDSSTGTIAQELRYDKFGRVSMDTNPGFQPFGFAGGLYDHHTGLVRFGARDYDPEIGRWTSSDPSHFQGRQTNLYVYSANDPINVIDPTGFDSIFIHYDYYPIRVDFLDTELPLGHAAVVAVNPKTGYTKYFEFGRYDGPEGNVERRRGIPNLTMGDDGKPTSESLDNLMSYLSEKYGKGSDVSYRYLADYDYEATIKFAEDFSINHDPYNPLWNNCKNFARDAAKACREDDEECPLK